jgi:isopentenyl-diphosphate Delta-isomerase
MSDEIQQRKTEHVDFSLQQDISAPQASSWADVKLVHQALPEVDLDAVDLSVGFLGGHLRFPVWVSSLTGGHPNLAVINERLGRFAEEYGLAMGVGSQRAAIVTESLATTYSVARQHAPTAFLVANIGAPQLIPQAGKEPFTTDDARRAVEMIHANALALHLNYLQEASQPEGDAKSVGCRQAVARITREVGVPVIAKETGAGISYEQARAFKAAGVAAIDVGGAGGSSMAALEGLRAKAHGHTRAQAIAMVFRDWGISTPVSVIEASQGAPGLPLIATGGVRSGLDAARALALGATLVGMGFPFLKAASEGDDALRAFFEQFLAELRVAMQLSGAANVRAMRRVPVVVTGASREWLELRGFGGEVREMARRGM